MHNVGVANRTGRGRLYLSRCSNWHTFRPEDSKGVPRWREYARTYSGSIDVPTITLWDLVQGRRELDLIRMDVEGYEVKILESLIPHLRGSNFRASILFETHPEFYDDAECDMRPVLRALYADADYSVKYLVADGRSGDVCRQIPDAGGLLVESLPQHDLAIYYRIPMDLAVDLISESDHVHVALLERARGGAAARSCLDRAAV
jgi:FkbM family methyltransferase